MNVCEQFTALTNGGDFLGTYCCTCGDKEADHKKNEIPNLEHNCGSWTRCKPRNRSIAREARVTGNNHE